MPIKKITPEIIINGSTIPGNMDRQYYLGNPYYSALFYPEKFLFKGKMLKLDKTTYHDHENVQDQISEKKYDSNIENDFKIREDYYSALGTHTLILSAMTHMSIYGHPDFKAFCVRQLKKEGLTPMQLSYHEGKPFGRISQKPKYEHYLLDLTIPAESDDHTDGKAGKKRYHLVRGHLMRTREGKFTWRKSHWRGNRKLGVITKDYNIKIDKRIKKEAQAS